MALAGDLDPGQRAGIRRDRVGCVGRSARGHAPLHSTGEAGSTCVYRKFQRKFRDECLNEHWFLTLQEAQVVIEAWRREYNEERTHRTIGDVTPMEFLHTHQDRPHAAQESTSLALV